MTYTPPSQCPVCGNHLTVMTLSCSKCNTQISGNFTPCKYCSLSDKHRLFMETFLKCRGNIKEVERTLSISYPTVKGLLDELLYVLFQTQGNDETQQEIKDMRAEILDRLERKELTASEAAELLAALKNNN
ncbi:MAG: DUF2089 domain-containing protein [Clostridiales bacterium]|nr:DUF2089 domain-containing protein [Clostridiales bacterium]